MNTATIKMDKAEAKQHYREYLAVTKTRKEKYVEDLKNLYRYLSKGARVLDVYQAFKQSGVNAQGEPQLGIAPASWREVTFIKQPLGAGFFAKDRWSANSKDSVVLPSNTFEPWKTRLSPTEWDKSRQVIERELITAKVPIVPAPLMPHAQDLKDYFILFEVAQWNEVPEARDPYLLKRINANAFVVLAEWDVTEIELSVMRGLK